MRLRRARLLRLAFVLANLLTALTALGVGALALLTRETPAPPPAPRPVILPAGFAMGFEPAAPLSLRPASPLPNPVRPTAYEDLQILIDAPADFERQYRVLFASLEREPAERRCIIERRGAPSGRPDGRSDREDQRVLAPNDRMGSWLLLAIDPEPTAPRSVRLRFRDLRRGEDIVTVLAPDL